MASILLFFSRKQHERKHAILFWSFLRSRHEARTYYLWTKSPHSLWPQIPNWTWITALNQYTHTLAKRSIFICSVFLPICPAFWVCVSSDLLQRGSLGAINRHLDSHWAMPTWLMNVICGNEIWFPMEVLNKSKTRKTLPLNKHHPESVGMNNDTKRYGTNTVSLLN